MYISCNYKCSPYRYIIFNTATALPHNLEASYCCFTYLPKSLILFVFGLDTLEDSKTAQAFFHRVCILFYYLLIPINLFMSISFTKRFMC